MKNKPNKTARAISLISKILLIVSLAGGAIYLLINFLSPTLSMVKVNGVLEKDTSFIIITSSFIFAPCLIFSACLNGLTVGIVGEVENGVAVVVPFQGSAVPGILVSGAAGENFRSFLG